MASTEGWDTHGLAQRGGTAAMEDLMAGEMLARNMELFENTPGY